MVPSEASLTSLRGRVGVAKASLRFAMKKRLHARSLLSLTLATLKENERETLAC